MFEIISPWKEFFTARVSRFTVRSDRVDLIKVQIFLRLYIISSNKFIVMKPILLHRYLQFDHRHRWYNFKYFHKSNITSSSCLFSFQIPNSLSRLGTLSGNKFKAYLLQQLCCRLHTRTEAGQFDLLQNKSCDTIGNVLSFDTNTFTWSGNSGKV